MKISIKRAYEKAARDDGFRVLVDRLWPRGVPKASARIDLWMKEIAPSPKLRLWFHGDKIARWKEFSKRYGDELERGTEVVALKTILREKPKVTLVTAVKNFEHSHTPVLMQHLNH